MSETLQFVVRHGYMLVFAWVFVEQAGLPIPSAPLLLAVGALSGMHQMNLGVAIAFAAVGAIASDSMWYELGRRKGVRVLQFLCRISLEPDSCVRRTQVSFGRNGPRVLAGREIYSRPERHGRAACPGLSAWAGGGSCSSMCSGRCSGSAPSRSPATCSAANSSGSRHRRLIWESGCWSSCWRDSRATFSGNSTIARRFLRKLKIARITPEELKEKIDAGEDILIVDLRHALDFDANPETIPGALHVDAAELEEASEVIPRDREIVLFCACPNEVTAARLALLLRSKGITQIRPLAEGYEGWRSRGFPLSLPRKIRRRGTGKRGTSESLVWNTHGFYNRIPFAESARLLVAPASRRRIVYRREIHESRRDAGPQGLLRKFFATQERCLELGSQLAGF